MVSYTTPRAQCCWMAGVPEDCKASWDAPLYINRMKLRDLSEWSFFPNKRDLFCDFRGISL